MASNFVQIKTAAQEIKFEGNEDLEEYLKKIEELWYVFQLAEMKVDEYLKIKTLEWTLHGSAKKWYEVYGLPSFGGNLQSSKFGEAVENSIWEEEKFHIKIRDRIFLNVPGMERNVSGFYTKENRVSERN